MLLLRSHDQITVTVDQLGYSDYEYAYILYMYCLSSLLNIVFPCLVEVPVFAKNNTKIFKISTNINLMTTYMKIKILVTSCTKDNDFSFIIINI